MMKVYHDAEGRVLYTMTGSATPAGSYIEVEEADLGDLTGWRVVEGALEAVPGVALDNARTTAVARINTAAGQVRSLYVTDILGQPTIYRMKEEEARAWLADPAPDPANYPFIAAEIGWTAPTGDEVAQVYLNLAAIYVQAAAQLEHVRISHITTAENAATPEATEAAADAFDLMIQTQIGGAP